MPLNYQQILMEMNRPHRRTGSSFLKRAAWLLLFAVVFAGGYAIWNFGLLNRAGESVVALYRGYAPEWMPWSAAAPDDGGLSSVDQILASGFPGQQDGDAGGSAAAGQAPRNAGTSLPAGMPVPHSSVPAPDGPLRVEAASRSTPKPSLAEAAAQTERISGLSPAAAAARSQALPQAQPQARPAAPAGAQAAPAALSPAGAQLRHIDQLLRTDPSEALRKLDELTAAVRLQPDEAADAGYRAGYAARLVKDEARAEKSWAETAEKYPATRGGRYSALALADTWFRQYAAGRPQTARWDDIQALYSRVIGEDDAPFLPLDVKAVVKKNLNKLNEAIFFGSAPTSLARYHRVESGELLGGIANRFRVDYESLARINGVNPNRIRVGMDLKAIVGDVSIIVRKNGAAPEIGPTVTWFLDGRWVREYPACVGPGDKTPPGVYQLTSKERDPSWTNPANGQLLPNDHPENILGSRWMAMKGMDTQGLGIHGTTINDSVPGYTSAGCIRLHNSNVEELFSFARIGASVTVID